MLVHRQQFWSNLEAALDQSLEHTGKMLIILSIHFAKRTHSDSEDPRMLSCRHALCYTSVKDYTEKNKYDKELPCPVCREVTTFYEGGVGNLPKFFFMNELKEVVMEDDIEDKPGTEGSAVVCSTEDCVQQTTSYCREGCQFICQQCYDEHQNIKFTNNHQVMTASEGEEFTPYPSCHRHKHQFMDLYCRKCNIPICTTCCQVNHQGHDCIEIDKQADVCKVELEQICEDTDGLINQVKYAMDKTKCQAQQAETDIDEMCENVNSTFKTMHDQLDEEEKKMLSDLQEARRRMKKTVDVITDSQMLSLPSLRSLKSCHIKLNDKDSHYDYVTVTGCIKSDLNNHVCTELLVLSWRSQVVKKAKHQELVKKQRMLELTETEESPEQLRVKEVNRIKLDCQTQGVLRVVWHNNYIYVVEHFVLMVYSYGEDGTLIDRYEDDGRE